MRGKERFAATVAGLALVGVPAAIAVASTDTSSSATQRPAMTPAVMRSYPAARPFHHGHCHHMPGDRPNTSGQPQV